jgi:predicted transcriptional regulator
MHRMTVSFGREEFASLQALARKADRSHAWIVRYAVRELLDRVRAGQLELPLLAAARPGPLVADSAER